MYNQKFGSADVSAVSGGTAAIGQAVALAAAAPSTAEDWSVAVQGSVSDFYAAGLMNATLNQYYGSDQVYEFEYKPGGITSGECLGIAPGPGQGTKVTLQPCASVNATWIYDAAAANGGYAPYISGSDTKYPAPYVLTAVQAGGDFTTQALQVNSNGVVAKDQMWQLISGVLGSLTSAGHAPAAPSNLTVTPVDPHDIRLSWQDNSSNETGFEVNNGSVSNYTGANSTTYTWGGLAPGTYMCFHVRAYNGAGSSAWVPKVSPWYVCTTTPMYWAGRYAGKSATVSVGRYAEPNSLPYVNYCGPAASRVLISNWTSNVPGLDTLAAQEKTNQGHTGTYLDDMVKPVNHAIGTNFYKNGGAASDQSDFSNRLGKVIYDDHRPLITGIMTGVGNIHLNGWSSAVTHIITIYGFDFSSPTQGKIYYMETAGTVAGTTATGPQVMDYQSFWSLVAANNIQLINAN